jgi:hypothetical protein
MMAVKFSRRDNSERSLSQELRSVSTDVRYSGTVSHFLNFFIDHLYSLNIFARVILVHCYCDNVFGIVELLKRLERDAACVAVFLLEASPRTHH